MRYRSNGIKYGALTQEFDERATADEMQYCADQYRRAHRGERGTGRSYELNVAEATYCQSLADRKRRGLEHP